MFLASHLSVDRPWGVETHEDSNCYRRVSDCCSSSDANLFAGQAQKAASQPAQAGPGSQILPPILDAGARLNPLKIALLKWYLAGATTLFPVGNEPIGLAFDGANIWSANYGANTVTKARANDGQVLGTFNAGYQPFGVTFDGANIWVSDAAAITKLRASDGATLGTFVVG